MLLDYSGEDSLYARRFLLMKSNNPYGIIYFFDGSIEHLLPGGEAIAKLVVGGPGLRVGCTVREHSFDERAQGVKYGPVGFAIFFAQESEHRASFGP